MMRKVLCAFALLALAVVVVSAASVDVAGGPAKAKGAGVRAKAVAKGAVASGKAGDVKEKSYRRKVRKSPIKGSTPRTMKGKSATERGKAKVPAKVTRGNAGMGGAGSASAPKPAANVNAKDSKSKAKANAKAPNAKGKGQAKGKAAPAKAKGKAPAQKPGKAARKMKFRALQAADAEAEVDAALAAEVNPPTAYPAKTADGWQLSARLTITEANVKALTDLLPKLPQSQTFYHWDTFQACTRWTRAGLSEGEMKFFTSNSANMYSGGGLYFAAGFENSAEYGMFPCRVTIKAGTATYTDAAISAAVGKKILAVMPDVNEKVALGAIIPFIHQYAISVSQRPPYQDWWVTHNHQVFESFAGGNYKLGDGTFLTPHFDNNGKGANGNGEYAVNIQSSLDLYKYWNTLQDVDKLSPPLEPDQAKADLRDSLRWMKSFSFLFSYIDGASLMRALGTSPNDPFNVFEKENFPNYQSVYERYINGRLGSSAASLWGWSAGGKFGNGKDTNAVWAKNALDNLLPGLYKELSNGGVLKFREEEVRAGGDQEGKTFTATSGQVEVMKANPYLLTVDSPPQKDGSILVYYYYPDPLHRNPALKSRVSPALWQAMEEDIGKAMSMGADAFKKTDDYKRHTSQLMSELILEAFTRVHGKSAAMDQGGIQIMLDLVSIHPCTDFNGRTTRFVGVVAALESSLEPPIAFMSDFDLTTPTPLYAQFLVSGSAAYLKLKKALTAELLTGVCNGQVPDHYHVSYWAKFAGDALLPFMTAPKEVTYDDSDWDLIRTRQFVPLMDKKLGTAWKSRSGNAGTPMVQTPGQEPELKATPTSTVPAPTATPLTPALAPNDCRNGVKSCRTCTRLSSTDNHGCGYKVATGECLNVYQINNRLDGIVMFADGCPAR